MKKNTLYFLSFITAAFLFSACQDKDDNETQDLSGTDMLTFSVNGYSGEGIIDTDNKTIYLQVPVSIKSGTNLAPASPFPKEQRPRLIIKNKSAETVNRTSNLPLPTP